MTNISIIVPVYNTAAYLTKCLDSLLAQTAEGIEIIIVNDGSTDGSKEIISKYELLHPEIIKVITQKNAGLSAARNTGILHSRGQYIGFVDSDDYIDKRMFELLLSKALTNSFDIVACDVTYVFPDHSVVVSSQVFNDLLTRESIKRSILNIYPTAWNKLFKRSLFDSGIHFRPGIWFEDFEFLYRLYPEIKSIGVVQMPLYFYRQREGAITQTYDERLFQYVTNFDSIIEHYKVKGYFNEYKKELEYLYVRYSYATLLKRLARTRDIELYKRGVRFSKNKVNTLWPEYRANPLFKSMGIKGYYLLFFNSFLARLVYWKENSSTKL